MYPGVAGSRADRPNWTRVKVQASAVLLLACVASAQPDLGHRIKGPVLGLVWDAHGTSGDVVRAVVGLPGAAIVGRVWVLPQGIRPVGEVGGQDYLLGVHHEDGLLRAIRWSEEGEVLHLVDTKYSSPDLLAISPTGRNVALYRADSEWLEVVGGLPAGAHLLWRIAWPGFAGSPRRLAVSDDGQLVLALLADGDLYSLSVGGTVLRVGFFGEDVLVAFAPNARVAFAAADEGRAIYRVNFSPIPLVELVLSGPAVKISPVALAVAANAGRLALASSNPPGLLVGDISAGELRWLDCACSPVGLYRLRGNAVFGLQSHDTGPLWLLDGDGSEPRIVFVPARDQTLPTERVGESPW